MSRGHTALLAGACVDKAAASLRLTELALQADGANAVRKHRGRQVCCLLVDRRAPMHCLQPRMGH